MVYLGAHVVGHYADGVRLIGLTDKQLLNKLKILNKANNEIKDQSERSSPYAKVKFLSFKYPYQFYLVFRPAARRFTR